eukprot:jgi/Mesen1/999/ME000120S00154
MAANPLLQHDGTPVPFISEMMVLAREHIEFQGSNLPSVPGGKWSARGILYLTSVRMVFVASKPTPPIVAFDMPLLYVHGEKFNQPIFACNNLSARVTPQQQQQQQASDGPIEFKVLFKEGGVGTFIPVFFGLLRSLRATAQQQQAAHAAHVSYAAQTPGASPPVSPLPSQQPPVEDMIRHAYVDPNDPTRLYLQQPREDEVANRRQNY